jgi:hypothetical protein
MAFACASSSFGIALSGVFIIASNTFPALTDCAAASRTFVSRWSPDYAVMRADVRAAKASMKATKRFLK